jgi:Lrp/AsnC family transcriptional regulator, leucine-responsive regulatory protein
MTNGKLDEIDKKILEILQQKGRLDVTRIARLVNKSAPPVHERIHKLEEAGFITGYVALLDRVMVGKPVLVITMVKLEKQGTPLMESFEQTVTAMPEIQFCLQVSGKWDFMLHVTAATPQDYYILLMEKLCKLPNVDHVESSFVLREVKSFSPFLF